MGGGAVTVGFQLVLYWVICSFIIVSFALVLVRAIMVDGVVTPLELVLIFIGNLAVYFFLYSHFEVYALGIYCVFLISSTLIFLRVRRDRELQRVKDIQDEEIRIALKKADEYPEMAAAYERLGDIYILQKRYDLAIKNYELAVRYTENKIDHVPMKSKLKTARLAKERAEHRRMKSIAGKVSNTFKDLE